MNVNDIARLAQAYNFAAAKHVGQRRKGEAAEPYMNHLTEVAQLVAEATGGADVELVMAAVLHDTVEDTDTEPEELVARFGDRVAGLVAEVTDDKSLDKAERKRLQIEHARGASVAAKLVKLADKICNLRDLNVAPPAGWSLKRKREYFDWAKQVIDQVRGTHAVLESLFDREYARRP